jgi:NAD-dependent deacetylase
MNAPAANLIHVHGELYKVRYPTCNSIYHWANDLGVEGPCQQCRAVRQMRPHLTWY